MNKQKGIRGAGPDSFLFGDVKITPWAGNSKEAECDDAEMQSPFAFAWKCALLAVRRKSKGRPSGELRKRRGIEAILQMQCGTSEGEKQPDDLPGMEMQGPEYGVLTQMVLDKCSPKRRRGQREISKEPVWERRAASFRGGRTLFARRDA